MTQGIFMAALVCLLFSRRTTPMLNREVRAYIQDDQLFSFKVRIRIQPT